MDNAIATAAQAVSHGDPIAALKFVALRNDPPALALRGIAMAQLGEYSRARELLRYARRSFAAREIVARARCVVAEAEIALATRDVAESSRLLVNAAHTLEAHGDKVNARHARLIEVRRLLLLGRLRDAEAALTRLAKQHLPPALAAVTCLATAELMLRSLRVDAGRAALDEAYDAAQRSRVPALLAEVGHARQVLKKPAARLISLNGERELHLDEVAELLGSDALVLDACRRGFRMGAYWLSLISRPVLFGLAHALARAWPGEVDRQSLITSAFRTRHGNETHRARLRVEISRLRALLAGLAHIRATERGFAIQPLEQQSLVVLEPLIEEDSAALIAVLADGAAWSSSALAHALGANQRTVQRALAELEAQGQVRSMGRGRAQRWLAPPLTQITTTLLLPTVIPME